MTKREDLSRRDAELRVRKQELGNRLKKLEGTGADVSNNEEMEAIHVTEERLDEIYSVRKEMDEINKELREINEKRRNLPSSNPES